MKKFGRGNLMKKIGIAFLLFLVSASVICAQGTFQTIVAPNDGALAEGNSQLSSPFGGRHQFLYGASQFSALPIGGAWLSYVIFRVDTPTGGFGATATVSNLQIRASTTLQTVGSLSPVFSENIGTDATLIFGPGNLSVGQGRVFGESPQPFGAYGVMFAPQTFWYDPSQGNLLLDFEGPFGSYGGNSLDAWQIDGYPVGSVRGLYGSPSGTVSPRALVAQVGFYVVPEPSVLALLLAGSACLLIFRFRRGNN